jgi:hypothetical protein
MSGPLPFYDRVKETATTTGTGTFTLLGASTGYQSFAAVGNGNTCYYVIAHQTLTEWECGVGTYTSSGTTLARTAITSSSNSGSAVNFSAGTKDVFISPIADFLNGAVRWEPPVGMRLSATTNVYVTTTDVTAAGTLYWTTVLSGGTGVVTGYNGSAIAQKTVQQKSLSLTLTSGKNYDVFYDYDGDVLALSAAWTTDTARADALADEQGAIVLGSDHTKLWLGTIRASGTNTTEDSKNKPWVVNVYNRVPRPLLVLHSSGHTYTSTWREWNGGTGAGRIELLIPNLTYQPYFATAAQISIAAFGGLVQTSLAIDSTSVAGNLMIADDQLIYHNVGASNYVWRSAVDFIADMASVGIGYHYVAFLEQGQGNGGSWDYGDIRGWMER